MSSTEPLRCVSCRNPLRAYFAITYTNRAGDTHPDTVRVCSVRCLLSWAYAHALQKGLQGFMQLRTVVDRAQELVKGKRSG